MSNQQVGSHIFLNRVEWPDRNRRKPSSRVIKTQGLFFSFRYDNFYLSWTSPVTAQIRAAMEKSEFILDKSAAELFKKLQGIDSDYGKDRMAETLEKYTKK